MYHEAGGAPVHALSDVDLTVRAGQLVAVPAPSVPSRPVMLPRVGGANGELPTL